MTSDKIKKIDEQLARLKAQKQAILHQQKIKERKDRTHRLIQIGAIIEKYLGITTIEEAEALGKILTADEDQFVKLKFKLLKKDKTSVTNNEI